MLGSAFCVGQRSGYLELCVLVSVHSAADSAGLASPTNRPPQEVELVPTGHGCSRLLSRVLGLESVSSSEDHVWVGQLPSSILTKLSPTGCPKGFYGKHCRKKCHCANRGRCHRLYGACLCDPGLYGRFCHLGEFLYICLCERGAPALCYAGSTVAASVDGLAWGYISAIWSLISLPCWPPGIGCTDPRLV